MKKETLEQIAEKYSQRSTAPVFQEAHKQDFIAGAKWQQEQSKEIEKRALAIITKFVKEFDEEGEVSWNTRDEAQNFLNNLKSE